MENPNREKPQELTDSYYHYVIKNTMRDSKATVFELYVFTNQWLQQKQVLSLSLSLSHLIRYYAKLAFTNIIASKLDVFLSMAAYNMAHFEVLNASTQKDYLIFSKTKNLTLQNYAEWMFRFLIQSNFLIRFTKR